MPDYTEAKAILDKYQYSYEMFDGTLEAEADWKDEKKTADAVRELKSAGYAVLKTPVGDLIISAARK